MKTETVICKTLAQTKMTVLEGILYQRDGMACTGLIWFRKYGNEYGNEPADSTRSLLHSVCLLIRCYNAPVLGIILKAA
jgi:hypothetical protein